MRIITDSAADIDLKTLKKLNIDLVPMTIQFGNQTIQDDKTTEMEDFWKLMKTTDLKTSQPVPSSFILLFEDIKEKDEEAIYISISSALSGTYSQAFLAKDMVDYDKIYIIDSKTGTLAQAQIVFYACKLRDKGLKAIEIVKKLECFKEKVHLYACLDTLDYLARGGRIPSSASMIGNAIKVKPVLTVNKDGLIEMTKMKRGKKKAMQELELLYKNANIDENFPVIPIFSANKTNCEELASSFRYHTDYCEIGCTIACHVGPDAFGFVYVEK